VCKHLNILSFAIKLLLGVLSRCEHVGTCSRLHLTHLLRHLTRRCKAALAKRHKTLVPMRTIVIAQEIREDWLQAEHAQEIERNGGDPSHIQISGGDPALQHRLEARRKGERHPEHDKAGEEGIDPAHDKGLGDDHRHVALHHVHHAVHSCRIGHRVRRRLIFSLRCLKERA
jgi:hypothetical protein